MSVVLTNDSNYTAIASSIRSKLGVSTTYLPSEMSGAIDSIPVGSGYSITVTTSHCTAASTNPTSIGEGNIAELIITPDSGYELNHPVITGASLRKRSGDRIEIENPTGNVTISIEAVQPDYFWVENVGTNTAYIPTDKKEYMYSTDALNWTTSTPVLSPGAKIYIKGNKGKTTSTAQIPLPISNSYSFKIGGNALTLLDYSGILEDYDNACKMMFRSCKSLVDASQLYIDKVGESMCEEMFADCTRLVTPPELPITTLAKLCYRDMFNGCTSLATAPQLPATTLADKCYYDMFYNCTSLVTPPELPATTLTNECYKQMFRGCTSLVTPQSLPATTLADNCYYDMFNGCTSLTTAPSLPATTLADNCYYNMFYGCTSLATAPQLPATTLANNCYSEMFYGCTSLTTAPELPATTLYSGCYYYMFYGCTSLATAPQLPATTLAYNCYYKMFFNCTSLTTVPQLPATTLANNCYQDMFYNCTSLKVYSTSGEGHDKAWSIPTEGVFSTSSSIAQVDMFYGVETDNVPANFPGTSGQQFTYYTQNQPV